MKLLHCKICFQWKSIISNIRVTYHKGKSFLYSIEFVKDMGRENLKVVLERMLLHFILLG